MNFKIFFAFAFLASTSIINIHACDNTDIAAAHARVISKYMLAAIKASEATDEDCTRIRATIITEISNSMRDNTRDCLDDDAIRAHLNATVDVARYRAIVARDDAKVAQNLAIYNITDTDVARYRTTESFSYNIIDAIKASIKPTTIERSMAAIVLADKIALDAKLAAKDAVKTGSAATTATTFTDGMRSRAAIRIAAADPQVFAFPITAISKADLHAHDKKD